MSSTNGTSEHLHEAADHAAEDLREVGRELRQKANELRKDIVGQLNKAASTLRQEAREKSADPSLHKSVDEAATGLEKAAVFLNNHSVEDMGAEAVKTVKRSPMRSLAVVFVVGVVIGLLLRGGSKD